MTAASRGRGGSAASGSGLASLDEVPLAHEDLVWVPGHGSALGAVAPANDRLAVPADPSGRSSTRMISSTIGSGERVLTAFSLPSVPRGATVDSSISEYRTPSGAW